MTDLLHRRRIGWLSETLTQLNGRGASVVKVGTEEDVTWLRTSLRAELRRQGRRFRTGHHHYLSTGADGTEHHEEWTVWALYNDEPTSQDHTKARAAIDKLMKT